MANILSQAKDLFKMQQEARKMQSQMRDLRVKAASKDQFVEVEVNGLNELEDIVIDVELLRPEKKVILEKDIKEAIKEATKKLQKEMAKDLDINKVKSMLGM